TKSDNALFVLIFFKPRQNLCGPSSLLLLILNTINVILWNIPIRPRNPIINLVAQITLHDDLLPATGYLRDAAPRRELLPQLLRDFLELQAVSLEPRDGGHVFALATLDALDEDFGGHLLFVLTGFGGLGLGLLFEGVLFGAFLGVDG